MRLLAAMIAVTPLAVEALGLGRLVVDSGLDEPLVGQIELISPTSQEIKTLKASLASREDFDIAGIERAPHLFDIKYTVSQKSDGRYYLKISTDQAIREPFLHFLVQVEWSGGRLIREYTALLDPPQWVAGAPTDITVPPVPVVEPLPEPVPEPAADLPFEPEMAAGPGIAEAAEAEKAQLGDGRSGGDRRAGTGRGSANRHPDGCHRGRTGSRGRGEPGRFRNRSVGRSAGDTGHGRCRASAGG
ncbi:MAG: hypothetical protein MZW92_29155 [Comamonadaceae bacterium]|nr:hypothetical protein [Comamonadaceae bacterium]